MYFLLVFHALVLSACGDEKTRDDTSTDPLDDTSGDSGFTWGEAPVPTELLGGVQILEQPEDWNSVVYVEFWASALPTTQELMAWDGDCALLSGAPTKSWLCEPECDFSTEVCIDGECVAYPERAASGTIRIEGLSTGTLTMEPGAMGAYPAQYELGHDLFGINDPITLVSTGGATPALHLAARGVEPFASVLTDIVPGEDLVLSWTPPTTAAPSRVQLLLQTGWHGASSLVTIWCETEDDGSLTVPASLTAEFPIPSCGDCGTSYLRRFTRDVVDFGQGPIQLLVAYQRPFVAWMTGLY
jgi:hypothetical protein